MGLSSCGFMLFCLLASNPFIRIWPPPIDGRDLNPLLQDPGLASHPPLLYLGYVGFCVPFAFAVAALIEGRVDAAWGRWVRPWTLAAWCCLTGGIALGSWWSYYELGWGGFWFWDPVENASLLPWLTGTALLHSAIVVEKREALKVWTTLLAIATFSLSLSGTFLVRSGILNSVHSFAQDPTRGEFILALLALVIGGSLLLFALARAAAGRIRHLRADLARGRPGAEQHPAVLDRRGGADGDDLPAVLRPAAGPEVFRGRAVLQCHGAAAGGAGVRGHVDRADPGVETGQLRAGNGRGCGGRHSRRWRSGWRCRCERIWRPRRRSRARPG